MAKTTRKSRNKGAAPEAGKRPGGMTVEHPPPRQYELQEAGPDTWRVEPEGDMRVPGIIYASELIREAILADRSIDQVCNVATLPGIVTASFAMPDVHWGYGFPIGGLAATDASADGVVSPGGVGFDISCGVRLLVSNVSREDIESRRLDVMNQLSRSVPRGAGPGGVWKVSGAALEQVLLRGAAFAVEEGYGEDADLTFCEDGGYLDSADLRYVSDRALERGGGQLGSLGSGNHFLELQYVDQILDEATAEAWGLSAGQVVVLVHSGSRGLGHQVCSDHVRSMIGAMERYGIDVPDRQLACAPIDSPEGRAYFGAMAAAANFGRANRQLLTHAVRKSFSDELGPDVHLRVLYDVSHNLAKMETHTVDGAERLLCVHRKGATRALPPGHPDLPAELQQTGQPVLIPGSMGTASWVAVGVRENSAFATTCHGAGRTMSRSEAKRRIHGADLRKQLEQQGIMVRAGSIKELAEEAPFSYKDVDDVVGACERAKLARRVARLRPLGVVKG